MRGQTMICLLYFILESPRVTEILQDMEVVMQGRYIKHQALKTLGGCERISMVTAFQPKSPSVKDEIILTGVRGTSNLSELYSQYTMYRLEVLERIRAQMKKERKREDAKHPFNVDDIRRFFDRAEGILGVHVRGYRVMP